MKPPKGGLRDDQLRTETYRKQTGDPLHANPATRNSRRPCALSPLWSRGYQRSLGVSTASSGPQALMGDLLFA